MYSVGFFAFKERLSAELTSRKSLNALYVHFFNVYPVRSASKHLSFVIVSMNDVLINPARHAGEPQLEGPCLFFVNPGETRSALQEAKERGGKKHFLFHSNFFAFTQPAPFYLAGPAMGAPMAVLTLEKLIALGAQQIIVYGWCGSLHSSVKTGDIVLPTSSISEEGTSAHYPVVGKSEADADLRQKLFDTLEASGHTVHSGPIWTTDAPYRETRSKIKEYGDRGILAVDMEFSALSHVAAFRQVQLAAAMLVSDELWHKSWQPGFQGKKFRKLSKTIMKTLLNGLCEDVVMAC